MSIKEKVSVYRRRPKCSPLPVHDDKENLQPHNSDVCIAISNCGDKRHASRKKSIGWINRSLSSRASRRSVNANDNSTDRKLLDGNGRLILSPNVYRKKRIEAPANFVKEQNNYFAEVDAFELEEETPSSKEQWIHRFEQQDEGLPVFQHVHAGRILQAVEEDTSGESFQGAAFNTLSVNNDPLTQILATPRANQGLQNTKSISCKGLVGYSQNDQKGLQADACPMTKDLPQSNEACESVKCTSQASAQASNKKHTVLKGSAVSKPCVVDLDSYERKPIIQMKQSACNKSLKNKNDSLPPIIDISDDSDSGTQESMMHAKMSSLCKPCVSSNTFVSHVVENENDSDAESQELVKCESSVKTNSAKLEAHGRTDKQNEESNMHFHSEKVELDNCQLDHEVVNKINIEGLRDLHLQDECSLGCVKMHELHGNKVQPTIEGSLLPNIAESVPQFKALLNECEQTVPLCLSDMISLFSDLSTVTKLGEGTFGEAFIGNRVVFKIVPMEGDFQINGETQKTCAELYTETLVTLALNRLRKREEKANVQHNFCNNFIETKAVKVCQGPYDKQLKRAWEDWDADHNSENDHPMVFPDNQLFVVFILADGGRDLEGFDLSSFDEARSLLTQVTLALAIAEEDCEFEHRDLHWGNVLIDQTEEAEISYKLDGKDLYIRSFGIHVHIIDFTLSRLHAGKEILFNDLSADTELFEGPKGDTQSETYRRMLQLTNGHWNERFLKTNCYWIHYLIDVLLNKKTFVSSPQEKRALRAFKKQVLFYDSAKSALQDEFFSSMWME